MGRLSLLSDTDAQFIDPDTPTACRYQMTLYRLGQAAPHPPTPLPPSPEALKGEASNFTAPSTYSAWGSFCGDRLHIAGPLRAKKGDIAQCCAHKRKIASHGALPEIQSQFNAQRCGCHQGRR